MSPSIGWPRTQEESAVHVCYLTSFILILCSDRNWYWIFDTRQSWPDWDRYIYSPCLGHGCSHLTLRYFPLGSPSRGRQEDEGNEGPRRYLNIIFCYLQLQDAKLQAKSTKQEDPFSTTLVLGTISLINILFSMSFWTVFSYILPLAIVQFGVKATNLTYLYAICIPHHLLADILTSPPSSDFWAPLCSYWSPNNISYWQIEFCCILQCVGALTQELTARCWISYLQSSHSWQCGI